MTEDRIYQIIARVLNGTASLMDHKELKLWRNESEENELIFNTVRSYWDLRETRELNPTESIRVEKLNAYARNSVGSKKIYSPFLPSALSFIRYAAAIAVLLAFGFTAGMILSKRPADPKTSEVYVSRGSRAHITLPDGSIVWLGHDSHLRYPENFKGDLREVTLTGEAFFDVESDPRHPFLVHTSGPTIRVTGTEFYVNDFPGEPSMETSLVSGKIDLMVNNRLLTHMQSGTRLIYMKQTGKLLSGTYDEGYYEFWKKGEYSFIDKPFGELAVMMKRIYNVEIVFRTEHLKEKRFTGSLGSDDNVYTLLEIFKKSSSTKFSYSIDNNKIYVTAI